MDKNYEVSRKLGSLSNDLALEDAKMYLHDNVFICRIGVIKEFDFKIQEGIVTIEEYEDLDIMSRNISSLKLDLKEGDKVILLQSSINIFNERDNNYFDKHYFYILNAVSLEYAGIDVHKLSFNSKEFDVTSENTSLDFKHLVFKGENTRISVKSLVIEADSIQLKGNVYINGKLFESHTHGVGSITYVNASGSPTLATGNTAGVS
ncbi:DUF777 family protein (plasmid) [Borrelia anserina]|uniref:Uncharacterized protein n=2 Tax=Borrelia anserina TaxID=143 RepID=W5SQ07_BORAN|nr:DUF777 family protein [Borrelia anserina]AHH08985.1 Hypothetical protein BAN_0022100 [Borrelia anserina BA2]APR65351.1 hypothetical protein N187_A32 [Borrelia anserina Es]UPA07316.1 DUF777 family protein [Borrelia anserina]